MGDKTFEDRIAEARDSLGDFLGNPMLPIPLRDDKSRTERVSTYVELDLLKFFEEYKVRAGFRSVSEVLRRLAIIGAQVEGYHFNEPQ